VPNPLYVFYEELVAMPAAEIAAVGFAVLYLLLAIRQNIWCWFCAGVSTAIYVWLFADARLYMESALNAFYFAMAVYGWSVWRSGQDDSHDLPVAVWPLRMHVTALGGIATLVIAIGTILARNTDAAYPYIDSATTFAAIWATFLVARKVLENWWYWLVIDVVSVFIYWSRGLELTALLFVTYVIMIPFGLVAWTRSMREEPQAATA
jgi:nicotinamide mononucleotide transporter